MYKYEKTTYEILDYIQYKMDEFGNISGESLREKIKIPGYKKLFTKTLVDLL